MKINAFAYSENNGELDIDTVAETPAHVREKYLEMCMGWRYKHPDRYDQDEEWARLLAYGRVVQVTVEVKDGA